MNSVNPKEIIKNIIFKDYSRISHRMLALEPIKAHKLRAFMTRVGQDHQNDA